MKFLSFILVFVIFAGCDSSSIKKPKPDSITVSDSDTETENDTDETVSDDKDKTDNNTETDNDTEKPDDVNAVCGNEIIEGSEECDGNVANCVDLNEKLYEGGKAKCLDDCSGYDTVTCEEVPMECGNNIVEGIEECDSNSQPCKDVDEKYESGTAFCNPTCDGWDTSLCEEYTGVCGDNKVDSKEACDGGVIDCIKLDAEVYESGKATCFDDCSGWDPATCVEKETNDGDITCEDDCLILNSSTCDGSKVMKCQYVGECLKWVENLNCADSSRFCGDGSTVGDDSTSNERVNVFKGTFFEATSDTTLYEFAMDLDNSDSYSLEFAIYEGDTADGEYTLIAKKFVVYPGAGRKMFSSGSIKTLDSKSVEIKTGKFYLFGVGWIESITSYYHAYDGFFNPYVEEYTSFGKTLGGTAVENSYPVGDSVAATVSGASKGITNYHTTFVTDDTEAKCMCLNKCDNLGDEKCESNWIEICSADTYGCLDWEQDENCGNMVCTEDGDTADCLCDNDCSSTNEKQCSFNWIEECYVDGDGCYKWRQDENCGDMICTEDGLTADCLCDNECFSSNDKRCNNNWVEKCGLDGNGCYEWQQLENCGSEFCVEDGADTDCQVEAPQETEYVSADGVTFYTSSADYAKGVFFRVDSDATINAFKVHLQQPEGESGVSVPFMIYENTTEEGTYTRIFNSTYTVGANGYYGPTGINIDIDAGKYYLFYFYIPIGSQYYYECSSTSDNPMYDFQFGQSLGNTSDAMSTAPGTTFTTESTDPYSCSYRMYITSTLR